MMYYSGIQSDQLEIVFSGLAFMWDWSNVWSREKHSPLLNILPNAS